MVEIKDEESIFWTIVDDDGAIQVRASIRDQEELRKLIAALQKRLTEETSDV